MTMWYITRLAEHLHTGQAYPHDWSEPNEAGLNAVKAALYYTLLRPLPAPARRRAIKLYNFYGWGYEKSADSREMIWAEQ